MKDVNKVYISGRVTRVGHLTAKPNFAYLNICVNDVPVVVRYGGRSYTQQQVEALHSNMKAHTNPHAVIGGDAFIQQKRSKDDRPANWEVSTKDTDFIYSQFPVCDMCLAQIRGKLLSIAPSQSGTWAEVESSYFSKNPKDPEDKGCWKPRVVRVLLDKSWGVDMAGRHIAVMGAIHATDSVGRGVVHVAAFSSVVL
jgi:hypothetical protein